MICSLTMKMMWHKFEGETTDKMMMHDGDLGNVTIHNIHDGSWGNVAVFDTSYDPVLTPVCM